MRGLKISKELKRLSEDSHKFVKKITMSNIIKNKFRTLKPISALETNYFTLTTLCLASWLKICNTTLVFRQSL